MSKLVNALQQQEEEYVRRPPVHLRTSKSSTIRHNLLSPTRTTSSTLRGSPTTRRRTNSFTSTMGKKNVKLLPRLEEENASLPPQVNKTKIRFGKAITYFVFIL